ncbi:MAG: zf-HC2 domain-containing protein [Gemmatimonadota bacterium]
MTDRFTEQLSAYLDDELPADARTEVEEHLAECAECRTALEELQGVLSRARALSGDHSGVDQWQSIAALIQKPAIGSQAVRHRVNLSWPQLATAAIVLIALGAAIPWLVVPRPKHQTVASTGTTTTPAPTIVADPREVHAVVAGLTASKDYDDAVQDLQAVLDQHRSKLDSGTVKVLERSLARIDRAIGEAQKALASDPGNAYLSGHLARTRVRKLDLLRHAAALTAARS